MYTCTHSGVRQKESKRASKSSPLFCFAPQVPALVEEKVRRMWKAGSWGVHVGAQVPHMKCRNPIASFITRVSQDLQSGVRAES